MLSSIAISTNISQILLWSFLYLYQGYPHHVKHKDILLAFFNVGIVGLSIYAFLMQANIINMCRYGIALQFSIFYILQEYWAYFVHKTFHKWKWGYNNIHSIHHSYKGDHFITSFIMHPLEAIVFIAGSFLVGPIILHLCGFSLSYYAVLSWAIAGLFYSTWSHTGIKIVYGPSTQYHKDHHIYYNINFGSAMTKYFIWSAY